MNTAAPVVPIWLAIRPIVRVGWIIAAIRYGLDWTAPDLSMYFGVYYAMPAVLLVFSIDRRFRTFGFWRLMLAMVCVAVLVWTLPNIISYTTGQFAGWEHGRFFAGDGGQEARNAPIAATALGKIGMGAMVGGLTTIAGTIWMCAWAAVLVWLPAKIRGTKKPAA